MSYCEPSMRLNITFSMPAVLRNLWLAKFIACVIMSAIVLSLISYLWMAEIDWKK